MIPTVPLAFPRAAIAAQSEAPQVLVLGAGLAGLAAAYELQREGYGVTVLEAAREHGLELPASCEAGVCSTCRTHLREGKVEMAENYALEPWEVDEGFVLACQAHPLSQKLVIDYDKT